jgi:hypothetical protein
MIWLEVSLLQHLVGFLDLDVCALSLRSKEIRVLRCGCTAARPTGTAGTPFIIRGIAEEVFRKKIGYEIFG